MNFQFGNLPYGYNPYSNSMTTLGGAFGDSPIWNLADSQVRAQMTEPLFANLPSAGMRPQHVNNNSANFYNSLLQSQAIASGGYSSASGNKMMGDLFQTMMMMKQLDKLNATKDRDTQVNTSSRKRNVSYDDDDTYTVRNNRDSSNEDDDDTEPVISNRKDFKFDENNPLAGLRSFVKNENEESTFKYGSFDKFAKKTYSAIGAEHNGHVTLRETLKTFGIKMDDLSDADQEKIRLLTNVGPGIFANTSNSKENFKNDDIFLSDTTYNKIIDVLGFSKGKNTIERGDLSLNSNELSGTESEEDKPEPTKINKNNVEKYTSRIKNLVNNDDDDSEIDKTEIEEIKSIIDGLKGADKETVTAFLNSLSTTIHLNGENETKTILGSVFTAMAESDDMTDKEALSEFNSSILTPLKEVSEKHGLNDAWNNTLAVLKKNDGESMRNEVDGTWDWVSNDGTTLDKHLRLAKL